MNHPSVRHAIRASKGEDHVDYARVTGLSDRTRRIGSNGLCGDFPSGCQINRRAQESADIVKHEEVARYRVNCWLTDRRHTDTGTRQRRHGHRDSARASGQKINNDTGVCCKCEGRDCEQKFFQFSSEVCAHLYKCSLVQPMAVLRNRINVTLGPKASHRHFPYLQLTFLVFLLEFQLSLLI